MLYMKGHHDMGTQESSSYLQCMVGHFFTIEIPRRAPNNVRLEEQQCNVVQEVCHGWPYMSQIANSPVIAREVRQEAVARGPKHLN